jgi:hypothetical protein
MTRAPIGALVIFGFDPGSSFSLRAALRQAIGLTVHLQDVDVVDLSRFRAAPRACLSHLTFEGDRAFPAQCRVPPPRIIEAVDVFKDCHLDLSAGFP